MTADGIAFDLQLPRRRVAARLPASGLCLLTGPSGAGKTSLLHALAGLLQVPGTVQVNGEIWQGPDSFVPAHRRRVGLVFQEASLLPHRTVTGNLRFAARYASGETQKQEDCVAPLGLDALLHRYPGRLSGGERARAALACALACRPRWLLLDEPLSALDEDTRGRVIELLLERAQRLPMLLVTHYPEELAAHAVERIRLT